MHHERGMKRILRPQDSRSDERQRMKNEEHGMKPILETRTKFYMNEFIFRDEETRKDGNRSENPQRI